MNNIKCIIHKYIKPDTVYEFIRLNWDINAVNAVQIPNENDVKHGFDMPYIMGNIYFNDDNLFYYSNIIDKNRTALCMSNSDKNVEIIKSLCVNFDGIYVEE